MANQFIDTARITVRAGAGGGGAVAFHREKYVAAGGPDGGDGGRGGDIILRVDPHMSTLMDFRYKRKYAAENGRDGQGKRCSGKDGDDLVIRVPKGTVVRDLETREIICDMSGQVDFVLARGGNGGWGNQHFATPTRQCPRFAKAGLPGQYREVLLELKLLADVGLVGFPNVGKSTLLSVVTRAQPKIANYHFTTLSPNLGVVAVDGGESFVLADIPGIIEGAADGAGLGHDFLRHVDRCRLLIHVVDVSGSEGRDPKEDFETINRELKRFNPELSERPMLVAGNKCDLAEPGQIEEFRSFIEGLGYRFFPMIAPINEQVDPLLDAITAELSKLPPILRYEPDPVELRPLEELDRGAVTVTEEDGVFSVEAQWLLRIMRTVDFDDSESLQYFQRVLIDTGVIDALREADCGEGDTVDIYGLEFDFVD